MGGARSSTSSRGSNDSHRRSQKKDSDKAPQQQTAGARASAFFSAVMDGLVPASEDQAAGHGQCSSLDKSAHARMVRDRKNRRQVQLHVHQEGSSRRPSGNSH